MHFRKIAVLLCLIFCFAVLYKPALIALAEEVEQLQGDLEDINRKMQEQSNTVTSIKKKVNTVAGQLEEIEIDLDEKQSQLNSVESRIMDTQRQIEANTELLEKTEQRMADRSRILNKRIRDIYMNGQISYLDVLVGSTDFFDFVNRYEVLRRVLTADNEMIKKAVADRQLITQKKAELERDVIAMRELRRQAVEKRTLVASRYQAKRSVLDGLESQRDEAERAYNELQRASYRIEQMIRARKGGAPSGAIVTGSYMWPANGVITSNFGWRTHPVFGNQRLHAGMDIGTDYGDPIYAADGGIVISAGWISGYGKTVIIEHNSTYSTLYAHASELLVGEGQVVQKGQLIARVGETGYTTGPNLHFEVRVNGSPTDPRGYLP